ncbi:hypothetical protein [Streptomyces sp. B1I3]|uniref:hypothetical protein n=1 Tax=Streptomyces sp. B1I3 TaxID=3042264 RepID=UPI0027843EB7|nr:hypothetical protein [Streptomyces sp. B1I3]MDQ0795571.1 cobalamin biosynthesis Mg chelatase CobN [Streptomyces sp. B1I3]
MIIEYTPAGGNVERYDARKILSSEAAAVGRALGMKWPEVKEALREDDPEAMRAIAWVMHKRQDPQLRFPDFDPSVDEIASKWDDREITDFVTEAFKVEAPDEERQLFLRILVRNAADPARAEALVKEHAAEAAALASGAAPKEPAPESLTSQSSESSTSDSLLTSSTSDLPTSTS